MSTFRRHLMKQNSAIKNYLCYEFLEDGTCTITIGANASTTEVTSLSYSFNGHSWTTLVNNNSKTESIEDVINVSTGDKIYVKGVAKRIHDGTNVLMAVSTSGRFNVSGNIASFLFGNDFKGKEDYAFTMNNKYFLRNMFNSKKVVDASNLLIPFTKCAADMYRSMFYGCAELVLPPTSLTITLNSNNLCLDMFKDCTAMTTMPNITFITDSAMISMQGCQRMFEGCTSLKYFTPIPYVYTGKAGSNSLFANMFRNCTSLEEPPIQEIRGHIDSPTAFTSTASCDGMFYGCTKLKTAPVLPVLTTKNYSYHNMFYGCSQLDYIKVLTTSVGSNALQNFATNCKSSGMVVKHIDATWTGSVPSGWTVLYFDPSTNKYYLSDKTTECDDHGNTI